VLESPRAERQREGGCDLQGGLEEDRAGSKKIEPASKFISQTKEDAGTRKENFKESVAWYSAISADMFS
jgi:hypothetical protein